MRKYVVTLVKCFEAIHHNAYSVHCGIVTSWLLHPDSIVDSVYWMTVDCCFWLCR